MEGQVQNHKFVQPTLILLTFLKAKTHLMFLKIQKIVRISHLYCFKFVYLGRNSTHNMSESNKTKVRIGSVSKIKDLASHFQNHNKSKK
jgi:hypothetical protein